MARMLLQAALRTRLSRLTALAVALALSGAGRAASVAAGAEPGPHRCTCAPGSHPCACPTCAEAEHRRSAAEGPEAPPCHSAARAPGASARGSAPGPLASPCFRARCGTSSAGTVALADVESFVLPSVRALALAERQEPLFDPPRRALDAPARPAVPPPRSARQTA